MNSLFRGTLLLLVLTLLGACQSKPEMTHSGFLSDYSHLESVNATRANWVGPRAKEMTRFIIDPIDMEFDKGQLNARERDEVATYFDDTLKRIIRDQEGVEVVTAAGPRTGRARVAITSVAASTWWMKIQPIARAAGAGTGGAAMEGELVDSVTGEQLAAVVQAGTGNQFNLVAFSTVDDIKSAIDGWAKVMAQRLSELVEERRSSG